MDFWSALQALAAVAAPLLVAWAVLAWNDRRKPPTGGRNTVTRD